MTMKYLLRTKVAPAFITVCITLVPLHLGLAADGPVSPQQETHGVRKAKEQENERIKKVFDEIYERNRSLKKTVEWLREAYGGIKIKKLNDIEKEKYSPYGKFVFNKNVYIIVHPGFYAFFQSSAVPAGSEYIGDFPRENIFERIVISRPDTIETKVFKEQERLLRDFIELMSMEKRLVILVLPKDYLSHVTYGYVPGFDEYARYINELTNMSESVIYVESQIYGNGVIEDQELEMLSSFLKETEVKNILLGGGYLGKCVNDTYAALGKKFAHSDIYFVPEITQISPNDMVTDKIELMTPDGKINFTSMRKYFRKNGLASDNPDDDLRFKRITSYKVYR